MENVLICNVSWGGLNIYVNKVLTFFDHLTTPSKQMH